MTSKHTPGPWALESVDTSVGSCHKIGPFPSAGVRSEVHACVYADRLRLGLDDESPIAVELLANARLIAAAPELLAELQRAQEFIDSIRQELHQRRVADWYPEGAHNAADQMSADMRLLGNTCADFDTSAVIAKATGVI
ncbi:hypothetical protein [Stenotrophomonas sp. AS1]|uniref:hypothetical protein n=1 Tax=Stenotrophomonas sp. AS1 TaxID=3029188 RepID=UPI003B81336B